MLGISFHVTEIVGRCRFFLATRCWLFCVSSLLTKVLHFLTHSSGNDVSENPDKTLLHVLGLTFRSSQSTALGVRVVIAFGMKTVFLVFGLVSLFFFQVTTTVGRCCCLCIRGLLSKAMHFLMHNSGNDISESLDKIFLHVLGLTSKISQFSVLGVKLVTVSGLVTVFRLIGLVTFSNLYGLVVTDFQCGGVQVGMG